MLNTGSQDDTGPKPHSIKVPRLYKVAANILKDYHEGKDSIKNLVFNCKKHPNTKALFALVMETANHSKQIEAATKKIQLFENEPRFNKHLAFVLINELLWGKETLPGQGDVAKCSLPVQTVLKYKKKLKKSIDTSMSKDLRALDATWPRYARVNTLCNNQHRVSRQLREEGWLEVIYDKTEVNHQQYLDIVASLREGQYVSDLHIPNLLVFPPKTPLYEHDLVKDGSLMLQDKSSCFPVAALAIPPGSCVLDACAAPGMKTSQIAAAVCGDWVAALGGNPPPGAKVIAVERSSKRYNVLCEMLQRSKGDSVTTALNSDFLDIDPDQHQEVEYIVLDPSCSGTGMVKRGGDEEEPSEERLQKLQILQFKLLTHALKFPNVKKVVYSTCAVSTMENEELILKVMQNNSNHWQVVPAMPAWERRGLGGSGPYPDGQKFVRADPEKDWCNGFFVAVLERRSDVLNNDGEEQIGEKARKVKKKKRNKENTDLEAETELETISKNLTEVKKKPKKIKHDKESVCSEDVVEKVIVEDTEASDNLIKPKKKKKNKKEQGTFSETNVETQIPNENESEILVKKKKKKRDKDDNESESHLSSKKLKITVSVEVEDQVTAKKKKKKKKHKEEI